MKIALLAHCHHPIAEPYSGGLETHTALVADELVRRGHQVDLYAKAGSRSQARVRRIVDARFRFGSMPDAAGADQSVTLLDRAMEMAVAHIARGGYDVVLNNSLSPVPFRTLRDTPMLTVLHTPTDLPRINAVITAPGWRPGLAHAYAAVSEHTAQDWRGVLPVVQCIPNGIDLRRWRPDPAQRPEPGLVVWAARITPEKGLPLAIQASRAAGMRIAIAGPIADPRHFNDEVAPLLADDARFVGHLTHGALPDFLRRGSVFVSSPEWPEPFGLALVEAMACGTPAAALPRGAAREVVSATGGVLAAVSSAPALADAIRRAAFLDRHSVRASVLRFDHTAMVGAYEQLLTHLVAAATASPAAPSEDALAS
ncbi:MAG TPA: glycosyltransferase [Pseudonocardia sp.]|nr:glycosyltransferase [Pseudonocardia sp.]